MEDKTKFMRRAIELANKAKALGEVPVGAVVVKNGTIIGEGFNQPISLHDPCAHAEIIALRAAAKKIGNYRLVDTELFVTLEPCSMCAGAMIHARVGSLYFAAYDLKTGSAGSVFNITHSDMLNHKIQVHSNMLNEECASMVSDFFLERRKLKKEEKRRRQELDNLNN